MHYLFIHGKTDTYCEDADALFRMYAVPVETKREGEILPTSDMRLPDGYAIKEYRAGVDTSLLYLDEAGNVKERDPKPIDYGKLPVSDPVPANDETATLYEALAAHDARLAELETKLKGGDTA